MDKIAINTVLSAFKKATRRVRLYATLLIGVLVLSTGLMLGIRDVGAQANIYSVQPGDTLSSIALTVYGNAGLWPTIYQANRGLIGNDPNLVVAGQRLVIPQAVSGQGIVQVANTTQYYTVQPGDSLTLIAFKVYGNSALWPAIFEVNRAQIGDANVIRIGQVLAIPAASQIVVQPAPVHQAVSQPVVGGQYYQLQPGDTLVRLSERFYGTYVYWPTIYALNRVALGPSPDSPPVGALIVLPSIASLPAVLPQPAVVTRPVVVTQPVVVRTQPRPAQPPQQPSGPILILPGAAGASASGSSSVVVQPQPIQGASELQLPGSEAGRLAFSAAGSEGLSYTVQQGDTLVTIARAVYGDGSLWPRIYNANPDLIGANPASVPVGVTLNIPQ